MMFVGQSLSAKHLGVLLLGLSLLLFIVFASTTLEMIKASEQQCREVCGIDMDTACPHASSIPLQSYIGFTLASVVAVVGVLVLLSGNRYREQLTERQKMLEQELAALKGDEKTVFKAILDADGAIFQSELIDKTGFSKVKVTRLLDKLEARGLVERRRRGMTNLVLAKQP
jgi:uncharacterized membrane protein